MHMNKREKRLLDHFFNKEDWNLIGKKIQVLFGKRPVRELRSLPVRTDSGIQSTKRKS
jgi:hypothetical protein